jgi:hypothetical protein
VKLTKVRNPNVQASVTRISPAGGLLGMKIKFLVLGLLSTFVAAKADTIPLPTTNYLVDFSFN